MHLVYLYLRPKHESMAAWTQQVWGGLTGPKLPQLESTNLALSCTSYFGWYITSEYSNVQDSQLIIFPKYSDGPPMCWRTWGEYNRRPFFFQF